MVCARRSRPAASPSPPRSGRPAASTRTPFCPRPAAAGLGGRRERHRQPGRARAAVQPRRERAGRSAPGVEPVMQLTCRDRNRMALQSDLLSAAALGIPNVLLLTGDHPRYGDHPDAMPVFDLDSVQLIWTARTLRDEGELLSGRALDPPPGVAHRLGGEPVRAAAGVPARAARQEGRRRRGVLPDPVRVRRGRLRPLHGRRRRPRAGRALRGARGRRPDPLAAGAGVHAHRGPGHPRPRRRGTPAARRPVRPGGRRGHACASRRSRRCARSRASAGVHVMAFGYERGRPRHPGRGGVRRPADPIAERSRAG